MTTLSDIYPPKIATAAELLSVYDIRIDPQHAHDQLQALVATARHLAFERDLFRDAFAERAHTAEFRPVSKTIEARNYLARLQDRTRSL